LIVLKMINNTVPEQLLANPLLRPVYNC